MKIQQFPQGNEPGLHNKTGELVSGIERWRSRCALCCVSRMPAMEHRDSGQPLRTQLFPQQAGRLQGGAIVVIASSGATRQWATNRGRTSAARHLAQFAGHPLLHLPNLSLLQRLDRYCCEKGALEFLVLQPLGHLVDHPQGAGVGRPACFLRPSCSKSSPCA